MKINGTEWDPEFIPSYTPAEMLKMGVFGGRYLNSIAYKYPPYWFKDAKLSNKDYNASLNYYGVKASMSLDDWEAHGWITEHDPRGWFEWYSNYYLGRRIPEEDHRQIGRWKKTVSRHSRELELSCKLDDISCRPVQRQALLHWAWRSESKPLYLCTNSEKKELLDNLKKKSIKENSPKDYIFSNRISENFKVNSLEDRFKLDELHVGGVYSIYEVVSNEASYVCRVIIREGDTFYQKILNEGVAVRCHKIYEILS
ncbi:MAG: hypothetical protein ACRC0G_07485 [Fusobacteriaceae bacterium]